MSYWDETLTPAPPCGVNEGVGDSPYPFNDIADTQPKAPRGHAEGMGDSPFSASTWDTEPQPKTDDHTNTGFNMHRGSGLTAPEKPGAF